MFHYDQLFGTYHQLHDNARVHTARIVKDFLNQTLQNRMHLHPPYSPALDPFEHLGNHLKGKVWDYLKEADYRNNNNLDLIIQELWKEILDTVSG